MDGITTVLQACADVEPGTHTMRFVVSDVNDLEIDTVVFLQGGSFANAPTYTVSATVSGGNGTVSCSPASVPAGGSSTCTAVPDQGYRVDGWTGACAFASNSPRCVLANIQANQASSVSFVKREPTAIPTLSQWSLLLLGALLTLGAWLHGPMRLSRR